MTPLIQDGGGQSSPAIEAILEDLRALADEEVASFLQRFFKTRRGEYGEGDRFLGIRVPALRKLAGKRQALALDDCRALLRSPYHEARLLALLILVRAYDRGARDTRESVYQMYLHNTGYVNNWDLVDSSAEHVVGRHLVDRPRGVLGDLAASTSVWERRIAIMATFHFIKAGEFGETLRIADMLLSDAHDLIHKAVGWMLREVGKRDRPTAEAFLRPRYRQMPRTMLRYAIERYPPALRQQYLRGEI